MKNEIGHPFRGEIIIPADKIENVPHNEFISFVKNKSAQLHAFFNAMGTDEAAIIKIMLEIQQFGNGAGPAINFYYNNTYGVTLWREFIDEFPTPKVRKAVGEALLTIDEQKTFANEI